MEIKRPPMGWNSWNTFGSNIDENMIKETADAFIEMGLKDAGYEYLVIDDCWAELDRDPVTDKMVPDHVKFPNGMKALSDYVHDKGLKFGMYSCAGIRTCANYPGSYDHEFLDANTFAEWGVDFLKYDYCFKPWVADGPNLYKRMSMALKACGRDILFSACNWGKDDVHSWIRSSGAHMYRSDADINDSFQSVVDIYNRQIDNMVFSGPGCYNDVDMLTVGMYGNGNVGYSGGCTDEEYKTQFALWCMMGAPLMLGCDIRNMNEFTRKLVTNKDLLRIDQDEENRVVLKLVPGAWGGKMSILFRHLSDNEYAIGFFNFRDDEKWCFAYTEEIGLPVNCGYSFKMRDVFTGEEFPPFKERIQVTLPPHGCTVMIGTIVKD